MLMLKVMPSNVFSEIVGSNEICKLMSINKQQLWRLRQKDFPKPYLTLAVGPLWLRTQVYEYLDTWAGPIPPGKPRKASSAPV